MPNYSDGEIDYLRRPKTLIYPEESSLSSYEVDLTEPVILNLTGRKSIQVHRVHVSSSREPKKLRLFSSSDDYMSLEDRSGRLKVRDNPNHLAGHFSHLGHVYRVVVRFEGNGKDRKYYPVKKYLNPDIRHAVNGTTTDKREEREENPEEELLERLGL